MIDDTVNHHPKANMAAAHALLAVSVELEGGRIVHQSFISTDVAKACGNVGHLWEKVASSLEPEALAKCGSMRKVSVLAAPAATHLVGFCMQAENSVASILDMGVTAVKFQAAKPMLPAPPPLSLALALRREPAIPSLVSELGSGRPAYDDLFVKLRAQLLDAGVKGHRDPKLAKTFLGKVVRVLFQRGKLQDPLHAARAWAGF